MKVFTRFLLHISLEVFRVPLCSCEDDVDPDPGCFSRWCHEVVATLPSLHYEGSLGVRRFRSVAMV